MNKLKELRKQKCKTQQELADFLNVGRSTITHYENGFREPDVETLKKLASFFNVSLDYLLGHTESKTPVVEEPKLDELQFALYGEVKDLDDATKQDILNFARYMRQQRAADAQKKNDN